MNTEELQKLIGQKRTLGGEVYTAIAVSVRIVINNPKDIKDNTEVKAIDRLGYYSSFTLDSWLKLEEVN